MASGVGHGNKSRLREVAVAALLAHPTHEQAAKAAGVSPRTLLRWLQDETFQAQVREARRGVLAQALGTLSDAAADAVTTLRSLLAADGEGTRLRAAVALLEFATKAQEAEDIEERIAALEGRARKAASA